MAWMVRAPGRDDEFQQYINADNISRFTLEFDAEANLWILAIVLLQGDPLLYRFPDESTADAALQLWLRNINQSAGI